MPISVPLRIALWAVQTVEGGVSGRAFRVKYSSMVFAITDLTSKSERSASFSFHVWGVGASLINSVVKEVTWYSDHTQGWIVAFAELAKIMGEVYI